MPETLLKTKLNLPPLRTNLVRHFRMFDQFNQELQQGKKRQQVATGLTIKRIDHLPHRIPLWIGIIPFANILVFTRLMFSQVAVIVLCWRVLLARQSIIVSRTAKNGWHLNHIIYFFKP